MKKGYNDFICLHCLLLIFFTINLSKSFEFHCPSSKQWILRANCRCSIAAGYICLFDENKNEFAEICRNKPYIHKAGYKLVIAGNPDRRKCESTRYQPSTFSTNGGSTCIFEKTYCGAEGQIIFSNGSSDSDRQCRCDYSRGYDFITKPKNGCYCVPSIEDCSCYKKPCPPGFVIDPDYQCISNTSWKSQFTCEIILPYMPKNINNPSNDNHLEDRAAAPARNVRIVLIIAVGVTLVFTLIMVQIMWFCLPKIGSYKDTKKKVFTDNFELRSLLDGQFIPKNIRDLQQHMKTQWKEQYRYFVETRASKAIIERIKEEQCFIISGPFGCGKSSLAFHIALKLEEALEYDFMIISNPDDLLKYASDYKKQVFLIDDVFGKYSVSEYDMMWWNRQGESFQHLLTRNTNLRLLMTSRLHIYKYLAVNVIHLRVNVCHINLISDDLVLTYEERQTIGRCYLSDNVISKLAKSVVSLYSFFPLLCANFYNHQAENDIQHFTLPLEHVKTEIENIQKSQDLFYLALSVLIVCDNKMQKEFLNQNDHEYDEMLNCVSKELGYGKKISKNLLLLRIIALTGSYLSDKDSYLECLNVNLFNVLAFCIGPSLMNSILRYGTMSFIIERMQPETLCGHYPNLTIIIPKSSLESYFERLLVELKTGSFVFFKKKHHVLDECRESFITYMEHNLRKGDLKTGIDATTVLHVVSAEGYEEYVDFFLGLDTNMVNQQDNYGQTALHKACMKGHINISNLLLDNGAYIDISDNDSKSALDIACDCGLSDTCMAELLLSRNAKIRQKLTDARTALHIACVNNEIKVASLLLKYKAKVNKRDYHGYTPLHLACKNGHVDIVELLITHRPKINVSDYKGKTALHFACRNGHLKVAELLLLHKANPNQCDMLRNTPIFIACETNHIKIVKLLLDYKADVNCKNLAQMTLLHVACLIDNKEIVSLLIENGALIDEPAKDFQTALFLACLKGYHSIAAELLRHGASLNKANQNGQTPLHIACKEVHGETVKILINAGANMNDSNNNGMTPLHMACTGESEEIVKLLISAGVDVTKDNNDGKAPLDIALKSRKKEIVSLLLKANVDESTGKNECIPSLLNACTEGNEAVVEVLLDSVAYVNEVDKDGMTPLLMACKGGKENIVTMLINAGVDVNKGNTNGITPLLMACDEGNEAIVKVLLNSVAIVNKSDTNGMTPLHAACKIGNNNLVSLLLKAGAEVNKCDKNGIKPLHIAYKKTGNGGLNLGAEGETVGFMIFDNTCRGGIKEIIRLLLDAGASVNKDDTYDAIPVQVAYPNEKKFIRDLFFS